MANPGTPFDIRSSASTVGVAQKGRECQDADGAVVFGILCKDCLRIGLGFGAITPRRGNLVPDR